MPRLPLVVLCCYLAVCYAGIVNVATVAQLKTAISNAVAGDIITLLRDSTSWTSTSWA